MSQIIYVVTEGCYSDYGIEGVFSTKENAERFISFLNPSTDRRIEEYTLDKQNAWPDGMQYFYVKFDRNGKSTCRQEDPRDEDKSVRAHGDGVHMGTNCWARDREHAIKIANERRAQTIAAGGWEPDWHKWREREKARGTIQ